MWLSRTEKFFRLHPHNLLYFVPVHLHQHLFQSLPRVLHTVVLQSQQFLLYHLVLVGILSHHTPIQWVPDLDLAVFCLFFVKW